MWPRKDLSAAAAAAGLSAAHGYEPACSTASRPASTLSPVRTLENTHTLNPGPLPQLFSSTIQCTLRMYILFVIYLSYI